MLKAGPRPQGSAESCQPCSPSKALLLCSGDCQGCEGTYQRSTLKMGLLCKRWEWHINKNPLLPLMHSFPSGIPSCSLQHLYTPLCTAAGVREQSAYTWQWPWVETCYYLLNANLNQSCKHWWLLVRVSRIHQKNIFTGVERTTLQLVAAPSGKESAFEFSSSLDKYSSPVCFSSSFSWFTASLVSSPFLVLG